MTDLRKAAEMAFDLLCDAVEPTATQVQADIGMCAQWDVDAIECIEILRQALAQPEQDDDAIEYAKRLAECIWEKHYKEESPHWRPSDNTLSVLTQIDNMTCGLEKAQPEQEPVAWTISGLVTDFSRDFSAYKTKTYTVPLYTAPPKREWVGLTDEEILIATYELRDVLSVKKIIKSIEAKLKEKNT